MGGQDSIDDSRDNLKKNLDRKNDSDGLTNGKTTPSKQQTDSYAKACSTSSSSSQNIASQISPSATTSPAPSQQEKIDQTQWCSVEWFGCGDFWQNDFAKWIILALEEKESSEQENIERGLAVVKREIDEIFNAGMINLDSYKFCSDLIARCKDIRLNFDGAKRNELLNIIFKLLQVEYERAVLLIETIGQMNVEQRSVLRFMTHQKIQARVAFLRTTLKTHKSTETYQYHCITNPYYKEVFTQRNMLQDTINSVKASNNDLSGKYNKLSNNNDELIEKSDKLEQENIVLKGKLERLQTEQTKQNDSLVRELIERCTEMSNDKTKTLQEHDDKMKLEYEARIKKLQEHGDKMKLEYEARIKQLQERMKSEYEERIKQLQERTKSEYEERIKQLQGRIKSEYEAHTNQLQEEAEELRKEARSAKDEALNYQAALGSATNIRWSDSTFNNPIQLTKNIEKFQHSLADFAKVKGKSIKVDENAAKQLLAHYGCKANPNAKEIKNYLAAALQRMVLETIFNSAENLYKYAEKVETFADGRIESFIVYYNHHLVKYTNLLASNREGQDSITAITPVKIRQQVYAALGSRGFAKSNHPLVKKLVNDILSKMDKYREIVDEEKKKDLYLEAEKIIRTGMQLWFCLRAQEPIPKICWFKPGSRLETHLMVGSWEDENVKEMEVDFAFFPLIITEHDNQVFNKAQVFARPKPNGRLQKLKDLFS